jgi:hypothetical protein
MDVAEDVRHDGRPRHAARTGNDDAVVTPAQQLVSRAWTAGVIVLILVGMASFSGMALVLDGAGRAVGVAGTVFFGLHLVAAVRAFVLPRRRREMPVDESGTTTIQAPGSLVWPLVVAWGAVPVLAAAFVVQAIVDFDSIESPGAVLVVVLGTVFGLPDWCRLVTGRLHRWRVVLGSDGLRYSGYRTVIEVPWSKIRGARIQTGGTTRGGRKQRRTAGVLIDLKGARSDPVIPIAAFDVPAEQIVEEIEKRRR